MTTLFLKNNKGENRDRRKIIVLQHNEGQLGNQLWLFSNLIAYALEKDFDIDIWCFYQYGKFFKTPFPKNKFIKVFYKTFPTKVFSNKNLFRIARKIHGFFYKIFVVYPIKIFYKNKIIDSSKVKFILDNEDKKLQIIKDFETKNNFSTLFTIDWNFNCFSFLEKHRDDIKEIFKPKDDILLRIENYFSDIKKKFDNIIGLHLRYKEAGDGNFDDPNIFCFLQDKDLEEVSKQIKEFIKKKNFDLSKTAILIASNNKNLDINKFRDFNVFFKPRHFIEDLFLLSKCDIIFACKSSFSSYASYIGNKPLIYLYKNVGYFLENINKINKYSDFLE